MVWFTSVASLARHAAAELPSVTRCDLLRDEITKLSRTAPSGRSQDRSSDERCAMNNLDSGLKFLLCAMIAFPLGTIQHELGHLLAARLMKIKARLTHGSVEEQEPLNRRQWFFFALGGLVATWILCLVAFLILVSTASLGKGRVSLPVWRIILSCAALFAVRNLFAEYYYFKSSCRAGAGDERMLTTYLEIPLTPFMIVELLLTLVIVIGVFLLIPATVRLGAVLGFLVGGTLGYVGWYGLLGPRLLPESEGEQPIPEQNAA